MPTSEVLIRAGNLSVAYERRSPPTIRELSFSLAYHCFALLEGPNGSGKTTLLRCFAGLLPFQGDLVIGGEPLDRRANAKRLLRDGLGGIRLSYAPQGHSIVPSMTVWENLLLGGYVLSQKRRRANAIEVLDMFPRLKLLAEVAAGLLSGGEQQETVIARSLVSQPELLLIDEPMLGLDQDNRTRVTALLTEVWRRGTALVIAEHRTETLEPHVTQRVVLREPA